MSGFESFMDFLLSPGIEGEVSNDPDDAGKFTLYGISRRFHPDAKIWQHVDEYLKVHGKLPKGDMLLKEFQEDVYCFYRENFWEPLGCHKLPSGVNVFVADFGVQHSLKDAAIALQKAVMVKQDGSVGPITLNAASVVRPEILLKKLMKLRTAEYIKSTGNREKFGNGWASRLVECHYYCMDLLD